MIPVILDCDNTMGIHGKDVDDGLALLYLLGSQNIELMAVTTTFGNSKIEDVHPNTVRIFKELGLNIPLYKGAANTRDRQSDASAALVDLVNKYPNQLTILAIGSLTNLQAAYETDNSFFDKTHRIVMMGGIEYPLLVNGKRMNELNFSCDYEALATVLKYGKNLSIITGHVCLDAIFNYDTYNKMKNIINPEVYNFIERETKDWISFIGGKYDMDGFCNWDAVAAVYLDHPNLFNTKSKLIGVELKDMKRGLLRPNKVSGRPVDIPESIIDVDALNEELIKSWANITMPK